MRRQWVSAEYVDYQEGRTLLADGHFECGCCGGPAPAYGRCPHCGQLEAAA